MEPTPYLFTSHFYYVRPQNKNSKMQKNKPKINKNLKDMKIHTHSHVYTYTHQTTFWNICRTLWLGILFLNIDQLPTRQQMVCYCKREWHTKKSKSTNSMVFRSLGKWHVFFFWRKIKTSAVAFLPCEPQELLKTRPETLLEARADTLLAFWGPATLPSCFLCWDTHQEMHPSQQPHPWRGGQPCPVSTRRLGQAWEGTRGGVCQDNKVVRKVHRNIQECGNTQDTHARILTHKYHGRKLNREM